MIEMTTDGAIAKARQEQKGRFLASYVGAEKTVIDKFKEIVEKAVDVETFTKTYSAEKFQIFSPQAFSRIQEEVKKSLDSNGVNEDENAILKSLVPVAVKSGDAISIVYVREKKA